MPSSLVAVSLLLLLLSLNLAAVWGILSSGQAARMAAVRDLRLQAMATARGIESLLASTRADFLFIAQLPPLARLQETLESTDPMVRRWNRLEIESAFLLFLDSHPEIEQVSLIRNPGIPFLSFGRRGGAPVALNPGVTMRIGSPRSPDFFEGIFPVGGSQNPGSIHTLLSIPMLLESAASRQGFALLPETTVLTKDPDSPVGSSENPITVQVRDLEWNPPLRWIIVATDERRGLLASIEESANWYRTTLLVHLVVIILACSLGALSIRQMRQQAALEVKNRRQSEILRLQQKLAVEERLASVGRLAAGLAHEINNPLEGISNYLELLEGDAAGRGSESNELILKIREGINRMASTTRQVLTFAEPDRSPSSPLDLGAILKDSVGFAKGHPAFKGILIKLELPATPAHVRGNAILFNQVFFNLLLNAAHFQPRGGQVELRCIRNKGKILISVLDQGPGIPEDLLEQIFEPFYSTRNSSGLGLAICRGIVGRYEGTLEAENRRGGGARFIVALPELDTTLSRFGKQDSESANADLL